MEQPELLLNPHKRNHTRERKRCSIRTNETKLDLPEPPVHDNEPEPIRITSDSEQRRNNTRDHAPFSSKPSSAGRKLPTSLFQQTETTKEQENRRQTGKHPYSKAARKTPSKSGTSKLKLLKDVRHVLLLTHHHAIIKHRLHRYQTKIIEDTYSNSAKDASKSATQNPSD